MFGHLNALCIWDPKFLKSNFEVESEKWLAPYVKVRVQDELIQNYLLLFALELTLNVPGVNPRTFLRHHESITF